MNYVLGFMFDWNAEHVVLIQKTKPKWQEGLLNGVGGKIEEGETPYEAMVREFEEETGVKETFWLNVGLMENTSSTDESNDWQIHLFRAIVDPAILFDCKTTTEEEIKIVNIEQLQKFPQYYRLAPRVVSFIELFNHTEVVTSLSININT